MTGRGTESENQPVDRVYLDERLGPRPVVLWSARVFFAVLAFSFFFAPMLYLAALALRFNGLALGGTVVGVMIAGYLVIYLGVRISRSARARRDRREIRHVAGADAAAKAFDDLRIAALHPVEEEIWLHDVVQQASEPPEPPIPES